MAVRLKMIYGITLSVILNRALQADFTSVYDPTLLPTNPDATESNYSDAQLGRRYASQFQLSENHQAGGTAVSLTFWGGARLGGTMEPHPPGGFTMPDPLSFRFRVYATGNTGAPDNQIGGWQQISTVARTQEVFRENITFKGRSYTKSYNEYTVDLNGLPDLNSGSQYFMEIMERSPETSGTDGSWRWLGSVDSFDEYFSPIQPTNWIGPGATRSRAFSINVREVPEPDSLLLSGLAMCCWNYRRRQQKQLPSAK